jgi:hypothetical protein
MCDYCNCRSHPEIAEVGAAYIGRLEADHAAIHRLLGALAGPGWAVAALELIALLRDHVLREESDLFPAAHQLLRPDQWAAIPRPEPTRQEARP